jgi:hypothetical protein
MFLLENTDTTIKYFSEAVYHYKDLLANRTNVLFWVEISLLFTALIALVLIGFFLFKPTFHKIHVERNKTLELFLKINKSVVYQMSQGKHDDGRLSEEEKSKELSEGETKNNGGELKSVNSEEFLSMSEAATKVNTANNHVTTFKIGKQVAAEPDPKSGAQAQEGTTSVLLKSALLKKLTMQYIMALSFIAIAFTPSVIVAWFIAVGKWITMEILSVAIEYNRIYSLILTASKDPILNNIKLPLLQNFYTVQVNLPLRLEAFIIPQYLSKTSKRPKQKSYNLLTISHRSTTILSILRDL